MRAAIFALLGLAALATAAPRETNADRLARGLPPLPPTRVTPARRGGASPAPAVPYAGRIEARNPDGSALGHVRNWASLPHISGLNDAGPASDDLRVSFSAPADGTPFDILVTNAQFPAPWYVGASTSVAGRTIGPGSPNTLDFNPVPQTSPGSGPVLLDKDGTYVESAIWTINPTTHELTAHYVNPSGGPAHPTTFIVYDIRANRLAFTGDPTAGQYSGGPPPPVGLFLVD